MLEQFFGWDVLCLVRATPGSVFFVWWCETASNEVTTEHSITAIIQVFWCNVHQLESFHVALHTARFHVDMFSTPTNQPAV